MPVAMVTHGYSTPTGLVVITSYSIHYTKLYDGWEAFYNFAVTPWFQVTPDFQYIRSGQNGVGHVGVFGMRLQIYF